MRSHAPEAGSPRSAFKSPQGHQVDRSNAQSDLTMGKAGVSPAFPI
jgi:hypothetical protein